MSDARVRTWGARYGGPLTETLLHRVDESFVQAADAFLYQLLYRSTSPTEQRFLEADLDRRRSEAAMVAEESRMFGQITRLLTNINDSLEAGTTGAAVPSGPAADAGPAAADPASLLAGAAGLVGALAEKNETMGEGLPGGGGGTPHGPGGEQVPKPPGEVTDCYEKYKADIAKLWDQKEQMGDSIMWGLQWGQLLVELTLCAGPAAVELILKMAGALKGED